MKFRITVENKDYGKLESEIFEGDEKSYEKVVKSFTQNVPISKLDFYDKKGNYIIIPDKIVNDSIIYITRVN